LEISELVICFFYRSRNNLKVGAKIKNILSLNEILKLVQEYYDSLWMLGNVFQTRVNTRLRANSSLPLSFLRNLVNCVVCKVFYVTLMIFSIFNVNKDDYNHTTYK